MAPESAAAERIAKRQLIGDLALERMIELLSSPRHDSVEMPIVESVGLLAGPDRSGASSPWSRRFRPETPGRRDRLEPGHLVILDNLAAHKLAAVRQLIESRGAQVLYLPPYSPDFNPIEQASSLVEAEATAARSQGAPAG